jgi:hypothetical protein
MNILEIITLAIFGILVLISYYIYLKDENSTSYLDNKYWFNLDKNIINILVFFQILAIIGFLTAIISWLITPPNGGTFASSQWFLFSFILVFFIFSAIWSFAVYYNIVYFTILSLIIVAIMSILLLAISVEETTPRWYITLGLIFLCITTVLGDGIIWNANYIKQMKNI